ncbi:MAG: alanine racemase [Bacteroidetes bacterium]|nr:alanine racemase [Bacteroidota bacterium]
MFDPSYIELDFDHLKSNREFLASLCKKPCELSMVVKGNAYGHGVREMVAMAAQCGVRHFSVYSADEAVEVFEAADSRPEIMIMGSIDNDAIGWAIHNNISIYIFDHERLERAINIAKGLKTKVRVHLELETGMNRTGMDQKGLNKALERVKANAEYVQLVGTCTHLAGAENRQNFERIRNQIKTFNALRQQFVQHQVDPGTIHTSCSAGLLNFPEYNFDRVRSGILHYGFWPNDQTREAFLQRTGLEQSPLKRVISWKSHIMAIQDVQQNEWIGYGETYRAPRNLRIAVVPVGYSHGFDRSLSNRGSVLVRGHSAPVAGIVNMNCISVDVTDCRGAAPGDEVVLIGKQGESEITVSSFSESLHVLNYELLTRLPRSIPRKIVNNGLPHSS